MDLKQIFIDSKNKIDSANTSAQLENIRIELLGRSGLINQLFSEIKTTENPREYGQQLNKLKNEVEQLINNKSTNIPKIDNCKFKIVDSYSLPKVGHLHPITQTERLLNEVFQKMGFSLYDGPEIESDEYCFQRLNVPQNHPAREMQDTIYIKEPDYLLRTQGSSIEARLLSQEKPPFKVLFLVGFIAMKKLIKAIILFFITIRESWSIKILLSKIFLAP